MSKGRVTFLHNINNLIRIYGRNICTTEAAFSAQNAKILGRPGSPNKLQELEVEGEEFRVLVIPGHTKLHEEKRQFNERKSKVTPPPRYKSMKVDQDWTSTWPVAQTFKWSVVPLPVRQGYIERHENDGIPPGKYANAELMKIPNFLHLSPPHIKKHCQAIKAFCTEWPKQLATDEEIEKHFPVEIITKQYVRDAPSHKDERARGVTLRLKLSSVELDYHARDKLQRLVGDRYDPKTDILTITSDRCPVKKQNYDYIHYLLTAVFFESWKTEPWEAEKQPADMEKYFWDVMPSKKTLIETVERMLKLKESLPPSEKGVPSYLENLTTCTLAESDSVQHYKTSVEELHNEGENLNTLHQYKTAVEKLLLKATS